MSVNQVMRCSRCDKPHQVKIRNPNSTAQFAFNCRCGNKISGSYSNSNWEINNASLADRKADEPVFMHEPEAT